MTTTQRHAAGFGTFAKSASEPRTERTPQDAELPVQTDIKVGDRVRSYDFPGSPHRDQCYVEGVVTEVGFVLEGCPRYTIAVERRVFRGVEKPLFGQLVYPPVNGTPTTLGELTNGVVRI